MSTDDLYELAFPHMGGHRCHTDSGSVWVRADRVCRPLAAVNALRDQIAALHSRVHEAAHAPATVEAVATAMLAGTPLTELDPEQADGWRHIARLAIEELSHQLDHTP